MELISVIVPVYNVEKYLRRCIDSILAQTYTNLEIILVDDGSPDNCPAICDEYAEKDSRIKVIHQQNGGLSAARNAGLDIATGDYIGFVDSDDYISFEMYEKLLNILMESNSDLSICGMAYYDENSKCIDQECPLTDRTFSNLEIYGELQKELYWFYVNACPKLYKRFIFEDIRFPIGKLYEDNCIVHYIFQKCNSIVTTSNKWYCFTVRNGSITHSGFSIKSLDDIDAFIDRIEFYNKNKMKGYIVPAKIQLINYYRNIAKCIKPDNQNEKQIAEQYDKIINGYYKKLKYNCDWKNKLFFEARPVYMLLFKIKTLLKGERL